MELELIFLDRIGFWDPEYSLDRPAAEFFGVSWSVSLPLAPPYSPERLRPFFWHPWPPSFVFSNSLLTGVRVRGYLISSSGPVGVDVREREETRTWDRFSRSDACGI